MRAADGWTNRRGMIVLGVLVGLGLLAGQAAQPRTAVAQVPDSGAQRIDMIRELRGMNERLDKIASLLTQIRDQGGAKAGDGARAASGAKAEPQSKPRP